MKEIQVIAWCDGPHDGDSHVLATEQITVQIDRLKPKAIDLCESCVKELVEPLRVTLIEFGVDPTGALPKVSKPAKQQAAAQEQTHSCPVAGCDFTSHALQGLGLHARRKHGKALDDLV
jgi:hypothetical protein